MTRIKTKQDIQVMQEGGRRLGTVLKTLMKSLVPGATPLDIERLAQSEIKKMGGTPSFMTVRDYQWATCVCVNDVVVHGIPTNVPFVSGDVVCVDIGMIYQGLHTDTAWTQVVGGSEPAVEGKVKRFLETGQTALTRAIKEVKVGNHIGTISKIIFDTIEGAGFHIVPSLVGHAIGEQLHEQPHVPQFLNTPIAKSPPLLSGMTLAIEVIYTMGSPELEHQKDGWTIKTRDGSLAAVFEHTIAVTENGPILLTRAR